MFKNILFGILIYLNFISISLSDSMIIECRNFIGPQVIDNNGKITNMDDAYSGQIIRIFLPKNKEVLKVGVEGQVIPTKFKKQFLFPFR